MSHPNLINRVGQKWGKLTVVSRAPNKNRKVFWNCVCDCGKTTMVESYKLSTGHTQSCSAICKTGSSGVLKGKHHIGNKDAKTLTGTSYRSMIERCYNPNRDSYEWYGGRGIKVCSRWLGKEGYKNFKKDLGLRPEGKTLDRIDPDKDYSPENCRWADSKTQHWNKRMYR